MQYHITKESNNIKTGNIVGFPAHGSGKKTVSEIAKG